MRRQITSDRMNDNRDGGRAGLSEVSAGGGFLCRPSDIDHNSMSQFFHSRKINALVESNTSGVWLESRKADGRKCVKSSKKSSDMKWGFDSARIFDEIFDGEAKPRLNIDHIRKTVGINTAPVGWHVSCC